MPANTDPAIDNTSDDDDTDRAAEIEAEFHLEDPVALEQFIYHPRIYHLAAFILKQVLDDDSDYEPRDLTDFCSWHIERRRFLVGRDNNKLIERGTPYCPSRRTSMHTVPIVVFFERMEEIRTEEGLPFFGTRSQAWRAYYATFKAYITRGQTWVGDSFSELRIVNDLLIEGSLAVEWTDEKKLKLKRSVQAVVAYLEYFYGPEEYDMNETLRDTIRWSRDSIARKLDNRAVKEIEE